MITLTLNVILVPFLAVIVRTSSSSNQTTLMNNRAFQSNSYSLRAKSQLAEMEVCSSEDNVPFTS